MMYPWNVTRKESLRRQQVGKMIYRIWTDGGSDDAGLAEPLFDGRIDLLGLYQTFLLDNEWAWDFTEGEESHPFLEIDRFHCSDLTKQTFVDRYMRTNRPVVIRGLADDWPISKEWVHVVDGKVEPDFSRIRRCFGNDSVYVFEQPRAGFTATRPVRRGSTIDEYAHWWEAQNERKETVGTELLYLKDWTFLVSHPTSDTYRCPDFFQDDWLNKSTQNAYSFCYIGPRGSSTVLHADVLFSFSWSTNVCGIKRWYLLPPALTYLLYDCFGNSIATHLHSDLEDGVGFLFPGLNAARKYAYMIVQEVGETIFVPSKWFHSVENLEACISVNRNWINGANITSSWESIQAEINKLREVGHDLNTSSQVGDDFKLLWSMVSMAATLNNMEMVDHTNLLLIIKDIVSSGLSVLVAGGDAEVQRVINLLDRNKSAYR